MGATSNHVSTGAGVGTHDAAAAPARPAMEENLAQTLIDQILAGVSSAPAADPSVPGSLLRDLLASKPLPLRAIEYLAGPGLDIRFPQHRAMLRQLIAQLVASIDDLVSTQVASILHHPRFQEMEAGWRGLLFLVNQTAIGGLSDSVVKIKVLDVSWRALKDDVENALEFDQSQFFQKVYGELDTPGGTPFGLLLGNYYLDHKVGNLAALESISGTAAAAFAPFVAAASPTLFGLTSFAELERGVDLSNTFSLMEYSRWRTLQESDDARFLGLVVPRVLLRTPYRHDGSRAEGFRFDETAFTTQSTDYLWGSGIWAFGAVIARAFLETGWFTEIRGFRRDELSRGLIAGLPTDSFDTDRPDVSAKFSLEVVITEPQERVLTNLGFVSICNCKDSDLAVVFNNPSLQKHKSYTDPVASANAQMSSMLQYVLCASRFAHYVKQIARDRIGSMLEADDLATLLTRWLREYTIDDDAAPAALKAKYPLRESRVEVTARPRNPGAYNCAIHLRPHTQLDSVQAWFRLATEVHRAR